jgi:amino acid adenylation domain-containing protein
VVHTEQLGARPAVVSGSLSLSWEDLGRYIRYVAQGMDSHRLERGDRVGVMVDHLALAYPAMVASWAMGAAFVPLNAEFPDERLSRVMAHSGMMVLVCESSCLERCASMLESLDRDVAIIELSLVMEVPDLAAPAYRGRGDLAYLMYTSGTTGQPKGVAVTQSNVAHFVDWALEEFSVTAEDRFGQHSRTSFDLSIFDIFVSLCAGATLCPIENKMDLSFPGQFLAKHRITICLAVPGVIEMMSRSGQLKSIDLDQHLRAFLVCGEALTVQNARLWREHQPQTPLYNLYGPTEATVACTFREVEASDLMEGQLSVPIGRPIGQTSLLVLEEGRDVEVDGGRVGRLMICGPQLALGYWGQPELTERVFIDHDELAVRMYESGDLVKDMGDGCFMWMGRRDQQVNIMGYRVELMEVEGVVLDVIAPSRCVVLALGQPEQIVVVLPREDDGGLMEIAELQRRCGVALPDYMVPQKKIVIDTWPRNQNGKVDRQLIKKIVSTA